MGDFRETYPLKLVRYDPDQTPYPIGIAPYRASLEEPNPPIRTISAPAAISAP